MTGAHWLILADAAAAAVLWLWWTRRNPRLRASDAGEAHDLTATAEATHEPERDPAALATPLPDADTDWLIERARALDHQIHRNAHLLVLLGHQRDRITAELCLRGHAADGTADLSHYLTEEAEQ